jgi:hypothetical protein
MFCVPRAAPMGLDAGTGFKPALTFRLVADTTYRN